jgi:hypothetical protein
MNGRSKRMNLVDGWTIWWSLQCEQAGLKLADEAIYISLVAAIYKYHMPCTTVVLVRSTNIIFFQDLMWTCASEPQIWWQITMAFPIPWTNPCRIASLRSQGWSQSMAAAVDSLPDCGKASSCGWKRTWLALFLFLSLFETRQVTLTHVLPTGWKCKFWPLWIKISVNDRVHSDFKRVLDSKGHIRVLNDADKITRHLPTIDQLSPAFRDHHWLISSHKSLRDHGLYPIFYHWMWYASGLSQNLEIRGKNWWTWSALFWTMQYIYIYII